MVHQPLGRVGILDIKYGADRDRRFGVDVPAMCNTMFFQL